MPELSAASPFEPGPTSIPSGTVTFLFTDVEGSTSRWEQHHDSMTDAIARHDALLRSEIERYGGFVFKTVGDAFCAAFARPHQALHAALSSQRRLSDEDFTAVGGIRVRMGIHLGTAVERDSDYFGSTVNRVARIMSIGHGGQVLVSDDVRNAIADDLPTDASFVDLGMRRLKDLMQPERVWQLSVPGLPSDFAPLNSLEARPNNLPVQLTALLGRERDLEDVKQLLAAHPLVTIAGAGGVGKTRLALQIGADTIDRYANGVWFADLASISDARLVSSAVARALEVKQSGDSIETSIVEALKQRSLLLILDNCEHVLDAAATIANAILKQCPQVRILTTSRQPLAIAGEYVHRLPSLSVPEASTTLSAAMARDYGAVALFVDRATAADNRFTLTDDTAPVVAEICRRLDGIPLAIELAASRIKVLSVPTLAKRLDERFKILTAGSRTALPRQKTLTALIDWSYGLLDKHEQTFFNRLGVFAGGFTMEAATAVCAHGGIDEGDVLDLLSSLTDKSLVLADTSRDGERFRLLESTRAYALQMLDGDVSRLAMERRHAEYFRSMALAADSRHRSEPTEAWLPTEELELDNFRTALGWALHGGHDPLIGAEIAAALGSLWVAVGLNAEARNWIALALDHVNVDAHPLIVARVQLTLSTLVNGAHSYEMAASARDVFERAGDEAGLADALYATTWQLTEASKNDEALEVIERAIAIYRKSGPQLSLARAIGMKAVVAEHREDFETSRSLNREAIAMFKRLGCERLAGAVLSNLGATEFLARNHRQAQIYFDEALAVFLPRKNIRDLLIVYVNIAINLMLLEDFVGARDAARNAFQNARATQDPLYVGEVMFLLGSVAARDGRVDDAARIYGYGRQQFESRGLSNKIQVHEAATRLYDTLAASLGPEELDRFMAEGAAWQPEQAVAVGQSI
ncbi:MAG TPA: adenylate/guanylate cyclase domain-containing protein [Candidatus Eremiobacteraceae bacterium]|nr:adenylate/guanylate cyclase domain-containing protein [Candidatus Eremiobacteraceae bacterium]